MKYKMSNTEVTEEINSDKMTTTNLVEPLLSFDKLVKICGDCICEFFRKNSDTVPELHHFQ